MFFIDNEALKDTPAQAVEGEDFYLQVKKVLIYLINTRLSVPFSKIEGQLMTYNMGYNIDDIFTVLVFDDGVNKVLSKIKRIDTNNLQIIKDISHLNKDSIQVYYPPLNIQYDESTDIFTFKNNRKFSLKAKCTMDLWLEGKHRQTTTTRSFGVNYSANFSLIYNENCIVSSAKTAPNKTNYCVYIFNEIDHIEANGNVGDIDHDLHNTEGNTLYFSSGADIELNEYAANNPLKNITFQRVVFDGLPTTKIRRVEGGTSFAYINQFNLIDSTKSNKKIVLAKIFRDGVFCFDYDEV